MRPAKTKCIGCAIDQAHVMSSSCFGWADLPVRCSSHGPSQSTFNARAVMTSFINTIQHGPDGSPVSTCAHAVATALLGRATLAAIFSQRIPGSFKHIFRPCEYPSTTVHGMMDVKCAVHLRSLPTLSIARSSTRRVRGCSVCLPGGVVSPAHLTPRILCTEKYAFIANTIIGLAHVVSHLIVMRLTFNSTSLHTRSRALALHDAHAHDHDLKQKVVHNA